MQRKSKNSGPVLIPLRYVLQIIRPVTGRSRDSNPLAMSPNTKHILDVVNGYLVYW